MPLHPVLADITIEWTLPGTSVILPVVVGVVCGLGLVGLIHFFTRARRVVVAPVQTEEQPTSDPFISGSNSEQRQSFRRLGNPIEVLVVDQAHQGSPIKGYVVNRSVGGLCLQMEAPIDLLAELTVRPTNAPHIAPWVDVVVKNCRRTSRGFEIGCQFVKVPPWPVLMMFG
jgi:hypothetical protein